MMHLLFIKLSSSQLRQIILDHSLKTNYLPPTDTNMPLTGLVSGRGTEARVLTMTIITGIRVTLH